MSKKSRSWWPAWFPYPSSWVRAFLVMMLIALLGVSLRFTGFWGLVISSTSGNVIPFLFLGLIGFSAPFLLVAYTHNFIWKKAPVRWPHWLPSPASLKEGLTAMIVMVVSIAADLITLVPFMACALRGDQFVCSPLTDAQTTLATTVLFVSAAYLYQYDYLVRRRRSHRKQQRATTLTSPKVPSAIDPLEAELNQLRKNLNSGQNP